MFRLTTRQRRLLSLRFFTSSPAFCSISSAAAVTDFPQNDAVSQIICHFISSPPRYSHELLLNSLRNSNWFRKEVPELEPSEIDSIIEKISSQSAIEFFLLLQNEFGFKHSQNSLFFIAHLLAEKRRYRALFCHMRVVVEEQGSPEFEQDEKGMHGISSSCSGSAPLLCELLFKSFRGWDSNHVVWDILAFVYSRYMVHDALVVLTRMKDLNIRPSIMTYNSLLHNLRETDRVQSLVLEAINFLREINKEVAEPCVVCFNTLMSGFCRKGLIGIAKSLFCMMFKYGLTPDRYSYNVLIHGLCVSGSLEEALAFAVEMEKRGLHPDQVTYNILSKGFRLLGTMNGVWKVSEKILQTEADPGLFTYTILICGNCQTGNIEEGCKLREEMISKGLKSLYVLFIHGLCKLGEVAIQLYRDTFLYGVYQNSFPHRSVLIGLCEKRTMFEARSYFNALAKGGFIHDIVLYNIMIDGYVKVGNVADAVGLYESLLEKGIPPTVVTFNTLINGLCKARKLAQARKWLDGMKMHNVEPTIVSYTTIMNAFCEVGKLEDTFELFEEMKKNGIEPNQVTYTVLMKGLCKRGKLEESVAILRDMLAKDLIVAEKLFYDLQCQSFKLPKVAFTTLIKANCAKGDVEKAMVFLTKSKVLIFTSTVEELEILAATVPLSCCNFFLTRFAPSRMKLYNAANVLWIPMLQSHLQSFDIHSRSFSRA
ncbi:hypothetical protein SASPL_140464 [Salvia splendens]|uniref:Pentatricopeptide repeat-containing protein At1g13630 n=1 Tax=Salvia splendens TaxID=180675 RepID=A0A8X8WQ10_SALSN|nr:hypothetical protein SASPL_140464 [Salvia splendens]